MDNEQAIDFSFQALFQVFMLGGGWGMRWVSASCARIQFVWRFEKCILLILRLYVELNLISKRNDILLLCCKLCNMNAGGRQRVGLVVRDLWDLYILLAMYWRRFYTKGSNKVADDK